MGQIAHALTSGSSIPENEPDLVTLTIGGNDVMVPQITPSATASPSPRILDALKDGSSSHNPHSHDEPRHASPGHVRTAFAEAQAHGAGLVVYQRPLAIVEPDELRLPAT